MRELGLGGCLADEMGLDKTVQVLAHVLRTRAEGRPVLVVAHRSLAFQWMAEAERCAPSLSVLDHRGAARATERLAEHDLVITTYGTLRRDADSACGSARSGPGPRAWQA